MAGTADAPGGTDRRRHGRTIASVVLLAIAIVGTPLLLVAVWADRQITDTDRYVGAVSHLADDPAIQHYVASELASGFLAHVDVSAELTKTLPQSVQSLAPTIATTVDGFVETAANRFTASSAFRTMWVEANRVAHRALVAVLTDDRSAVDVSDKGLTINVGDALRTFQQKLVDDGLSLAGSVDRRPLGDDFGIIVRDERRSR